jgi:hypothetical protein
MRPEVTMRRLVVALMFAGACAGGEEEPGSCDPVKDGPWTMGGSCLGMDMPGTLTLEEDGCSFTLGDWTMAMDVPTGGTVSGSEVTLTGSGWEECTGTLAGDAIEGSCPDGCAFTLDYTGG